MTVEHASAPARSTQPSVERPLWWLQPLSVVVALGAFVGYAVWSVAIATTGWEFGPYVSPFYSSHVRIPGWPFSPAVFIATWPALFRLTCYYWRKAYYRAFFWDPPQCAVPELGSPKSRGNYGGERRLPFSLLNLHRFFLYFAIPFLILDWVETFAAFDFGGHLGIGAGSVLFLADVILLSFYVGSCHAFRHLMGGSVDCFSCSRVRYRIWRGISWLNPNHGVFAWLSLTSVIALDLYIRLLSAGILTDIRIL